MSKIYTNPETIGLHAGWRKDENTNSVAVPFIKLQVFFLMIATMQQTYFLYLKLETFIPE